MPRARAAFDALVADVGVAVVDLVQNVVEVAVVVKVGEGPALFQQLRDLVLDVVAGDVADLVAAHPLALGPVADAGHAAGHVHAAGVGADADVLVPGFFAGFFQDAGEEVGGVAFGRVFQLLLGHDGEGQLCQIVAAHVLDVRMTDHVDGGVGAVAPEALAAADGDLFHSGNLLRMGEWNGGECKSNVVVNRCTCIIALPGPGVKGECSICEKLLKIPAANRQSAPGGPPCAGGQKTLYLD